MRVLLTGYEPFGGEPVNPSAQLATELAQRPPAHGRLELSAAVLPVDSRRFRSVLAQAVAAARPELVVALGQATGRPDIGLEALAHNVLDFRGERDNGGHAARGEALVEGGPSRLHARLPLAGLAERLASRGLPVRVSLDAGRHLCNALLYELLLNHPGLPALLVHVPLLPEQAARRALDEPSRPFALSRDCLAALLL
ncbi:MAG TPA: pyroglutamyl-peptidase I, partial [Planctomycetota bacterium]|nr:pyroglutamyl-peptidase I [Planctomycetota bacterium]